MTSIVGLFAFFGSCGTQNVLTSCREVANAVSDIIRFGDQNFGIPFCLNQNRWCSWMFILPKYENGLFNQFNLWTSFLNLQLEILETQLDFRRMCSRTSIPRIIITAGSCRRVLGDDFLVDGFDGFGILDSRDSKSRVLHDLGHQLIRHAPIFGCVLAHYCWCAALCGHILKKTSDPTEIQDCKAITIIIPL
jgi:hypothetical protein